MKHQAYIFLALFSWNNICQPWFGFPSEFDEPTTSQTFSEIVQQRAVNAAKTTYNLAFENFFTSWMKLKNAKTPQEYQATLLQLSKNKDKEYAAAVDIFVGLMAMCTVITATNGVASIILPAQTAQHFNTFISAPVILPAVSLNLLIANIVLSKILEEEYKDYNPFH